MTGKVILLTGVPASGKSTVARMLTELGGHVEVVEFGEIVFGLAQHKNRSLSYEQLRSSPGLFADAELIRQAARLLLLRVRKAEQSRSIVIVSHAVAREEYGFRITPDSHDYLKSLRLDAIIVLHAEHSAVVERINQKPEGRRRVDIQEVVTHEALQDAVAINS